MASSRPTHHLKALVVKRTKLGEQDLIISLVGEAGNQHRVVAKAARKPGSRFAPVTELFSEIDLLYAEGKNLGTLCEATLLNPHQRLRGDYLKVEAASCIAELALKASFEDMTDRLLYPMTSRALSAVEEVETPELLVIVVVGYVFKYLAHAGWMPQLESCSICGDANKSFFSAEAGGVLCSECAKTALTRQRVSQQDIDWITALLGLRFDDIVQQTPDRLCAQKLLRLAHSWAATHMETRLKALEFMLFPNF